MAFNNPNYGLGGYVPPATPYYPMPNMVPPDKYKQDLMARLQPQIDQYGAMYQQTQMQMQMQANSGMYFKVNSYEETKAVVPPSDGRPVMIFDETNGRLYSKRFDNGQTYVKGFQLVPLEEVAEQPPAQPQQNDAGREEAKPDNGDDLFQRLLDKLDGFDKRLSAMEAKSK